MTPEDVKAERIKLFQVDTHIKVNGPWVFSDSYFYLNDLAPCADRIMKWEFHKDYDEANYKVGNIRFWFDIIEKGWVRVGYEERFTAGGLSGGLTTKHRYDAFRNITSLQQIDALFGMMREEYK